MKFKQLLYLLLFFGICSSLQAQDEDYSYISDRKFKDPTDLVGYDFRPGILEIKGEGQEELSPGEYSFGITQANLFVEGEEIKGVYSINNINTTEYGYKLLLMNARNPTIQGHLKVVLNNRAQVDAMIFKRTTNEPELIFYQAQMPEEQRAAEDAYFTGRWEDVLEHKDSIWGEKIFPFFRVHSRQQGVQERLQFADSTSIEFVQTVRIIDKDKKRKKKKEGEEAAPLPSISEALAMSDDERKELKIKVVERLVIKIRSILTFEDGTTEDRVEEFDVKKLVQREDDTAAPDGERFQVEFVMDKGEPMYLYLTPKRTISSFETAEFMFLMKGY